MKIYAMLTLDLEKEAKDEQRNIFYESLQKNRWVKITNITTTWKKIFSENITLAVAEHTTKKEVADAAAVAKIKSYHAAANFGVKEPVEFKNKP